MKEKYGHNIAPSELNQPIIDSFDSLLDRIAEKWDINSIAKHLKKEIFKEQDDDSIVADVYQIGNNRDYLGDKFSGIFRVPTMGTVPPIWIWVARFDNIKFKLTKKKAMELMTDNYNHWSSRFKHSYSQGFALEVEFPCVYDLKSETFKYYL